MSEENILISNVQPVNKNSLLATCDVLIKPWKMTLHSVSIFQQGANRWLGMPSRKYESNGETKYQELVTFEDNNVKKRFRDQIMAAVDKYLIENPDLKPEDVIKDDEPFPF